MNWKPLLFHHSDHLSVTGVKLRFTLHMCNIFFYFIFYFILFIYLFIFFLQKKQTIVSDTENMM